MSISNLIFGPYYVRSLKLCVVGLPISAVAREFGLAEREIIKLTSNENPLGMPSGVRRAIEALVKHGGNILP